MSSVRIYKYVVDRPASDGTTRVMVPPGAVVLGFKEQKGIMYAYAEVYDGNEDKPLLPKYYMFVNTGMNFDKRRISRFIQTLACGGIVWHIYSMSDF